MEIQKIKALENEPIHQLVELSIAEGFNFLKRLIADWSNGENRFDAIGEGLYKVIEGNKIIGVGGLNKHPYTDENDVGRLRRFYIHPKFRRKGIGKKLIQKIISEHRQYYTKLTLRTDNIEAAKFYEALGFERVKNSKFDTHQLVL